MPTCPAAELADFTAEIFRAAGLSRPRAGVVARGFLEADLLGFTTHGLARVPANVKWLLEGATRSQATVTVLADRAAVANWDAGFLPGPLVMHEAVAQASRRAPDVGCYTLVIRRCQHIACLASYLVPLVERELIGIVMASTPDERFVSPFLGRTPVFSNNPIAFCAPTSGAPLLFDISMAITAGGQVERARKEGRRLPELSLRDAAGAVTDDPRVLGEGGSVMPAGGLGHGHKGYALTLMTEVLTQALGGYGRAAQTGDGEANSVFLQVLDPRVLADAADYGREIDHLVAVARGSAPADPSARVRVPGERAWQNRLRRLSEGVDLYPGVLEGLVQSARSLEVSVPAWAA